MLISKLELENIKSHVASTFEFQRGTTAITGENGAGKTTILEAIAWVLFDLLEYKKEDFLRRGAKKGSVSVTFESILDGREYIVTRDTGQAYFVSDSRLGARLAEKKEEVQRFLWQHLGLQPGTDMRTLFRQAIGVPQGTFTAIFLESATDRKIAFDRLLKVEEYRQAAEKLRDTARYVDGSIADAREQIARSEGEIARSESVETEHRELTSQLAELTAEKTKLAADLQERKTSVANLDARAKVFEAAKSLFDKISADLDKSQLVVDQATRNVSSSSAASETLTAVRVDAERHAAAVRSLTDLETIRAGRDGLKNDLARADKEIVEIGAVKKRAEDDLAAARAAATEIATLAPQATEQEKVEREAAHLRDELASARSASSQLKSIEVRLVELRDLYKANQADLKAAEERSAMAAELTALESRSGELTRSLAGLEANLARDERFQKEITGGLCPILSQKCLNLKEGETLEAFVTSQFLDLKAEIAKFEKERSVNDTRLALAREAQKAAASVESLRRREIELKNEGQRLRSERDKFKRSADSVPQLEKDLRDKENRLKKLDDPRPRLKMLRDTAAKENDHRTALEKAADQLTQQQTARSEVANKLVEFADLDEKWNTLVRERDATAEAAKTFIANEKEASLLDERKSQLATAQNDDAAALVAKQATHQDELTAAQKNYDPDAHEQARKQLADIQQSHASIEAKHQAAASRMAQLDKEIRRFTEIRQSMAGQFKEKEQLERTAEATAFIRETLKEAAPRVARNYVYHVSLEANQIFREITGNAERSLKWGEDYAIILEDGGYERPFQSLSGGEQMAAALSVRLAILKQLTDIRIAFFDEPTANMDAARRENFAEEISRIKHFDQLFVISHDETFDNYVDNVIELN